MLVYMEWVAFLRGERPIVVSMYNVGGGGWHVYMGGVLCGSHATIIVIVIIEILF